MNSLKVALFLFLVTGSALAVESPFQCPNFTGTWEGWCHRDSLYGSGAYLDEVQLSQSKCETIQLNKDGEPLPIGPLLVASHVQDIGECKVDVDTAVQLKFDIGDVLNMGIVHQLKTAQCPGKPPKNLNLNLPTKRMFQLGEEGRLLILQEEGSGIDPETFRKFTFTIKCFLDKK